MEILTKTKKGWKIHHKIWSAERNWEMYVDDYLAAATVTLLLSAHGYTPAELLSASSGATETDCSIINLLVDFAGVLTYHRIIY